MSPSGGKDLVFLPVLWDSLSGHIRIEQHCGAFCMAAHMPLEGYQVCPVMFLIVVMA